MRHLTTITKSRVLASIVLSSLPLLAMCHRAAKRVDGLIAVGKYSEAESLLLPMVEKNPDDRELHFLLGKVYLYTNHPAAEPGHQFELAAEDPRWKPKIARAYSDAFDVVVRNDDDTKAGEYMVGAVRADESLKDSTCRRLSTAVEQRHADGKTYRNLLRAEGSIGGACAAVAIKQIESMITASDKIVDVASLTDTWIGIDKQQSHDAAVFLRDTAHSLQEKDAELARGVLLLALKADPTIGSDLETVVLRSQLGVSATSAASSANVVEILGPVDETIKLIKMIAVAVEAYATDHNKYPSSVTYDGLQSFLIPTYIRELPQTDAWDHRFTYIGTQDGQTYRIISAGPDGVVANDSLDASAMRPNGSDDVIYSNGSVIQKPESNTPSFLRAH